MLGSYYLWKWAENDEPGVPTEVHSRLLWGEMPATLQPFDARPLLKKLEIAAALGRKQGLEWFWNLVPETVSHQTRCIHLICPRLVEFEEGASWFEKEFFPLGVSGFDEENGRLIPGFLPKRNIFTAGQFPDEPVYDITVEDLPSLLRSIDPHRPDPFATLSDCHSRFVQFCAEGRRFFVEWRENYDPPAGRKFNQWRAQDRERRAALGIPYHRDLPRRQNPDLLLYADVLRIFEAFLRGKPRPARYHWMNINRWFDENE